ncbi:hypothetical protein ATANTOWER_014434 [Ataeniobius toweri]|uniref:Uncharacterized protein n=1 Tax=Ataeniobius toweri TaxID=208326 RepID=A0ABU7B0J0_9TELE|nr:hypothetical protein [Ataeniobius toweri]
MQPEFSQVNRLTLNMPSHPPQHLCTCLHAASGCLRTHSCVQHGVQTSPLSDSELDVSSLSSLELYIPPPPPFSNAANHPSQSKRTMEVGVAASEHHSSSFHSTTKSHESRRSRQVSASTRKRSPVRHRYSRTNHVKTAIYAAPPKSILKQPASLGEEHAYNTLRKSKSVELLEDSAKGHRAEHRGPPSLQSLTPPSPSRTTWNWKMQVLEEKVRFSSFLDEITCRVLSPARLSLLGKSAAKQQWSPAHQHGRSCNKMNHHAESADRSRRWDSWVGSLHRPDSWYEPLEKQRAGHNDITRGVERRKVTGGGRMMGLEDIAPQRPRPPLSNLSLLSHIKVGQRIDSSSSSSLFLKSLMQVSIYMWIFFLKDNSPNVLNLFHLVILLGIMFIGAFFPLLEYFLCISMYYFQE